MKAKEYIQIVDLTLKCYDGRATLKCIRELESLLNANQEALELYTEIVFQINYFQCEVQSPYVSDVSGYLRDELYFKINKDGDIKDVMSVMVQEENEAPEVLIDQVSEITASDDILPVQVVRTGLFVRVYNVLVSLAAVFLIVFIVYANLYPSKRSEKVAVLTEQVNAKWSDGSDQLNIDDVLYTNHGPYVLDSGFIELQYENGAKLVVEAPASFTILSESNFNLILGQVYTKVPKEAIGFTITSHNSKVIDLGTEFGVAADRSGNSDVYLFKGKASLVSGYKKQEKESFLLEPGQGKRVDSSAKVKDINFEEFAFARDISSTTSLVWRGQTDCDLVQIVKGNNEFWKKDRSFYAINQSTGDIITSVDQGAEYSDLSKYNVVADNAYIDGVFIPDGGQGRQVISSTGLTFDTCPDTCGYWFAPIMTEWTPSLEILSEGKHLKGIDIEKWVLNKTDYGNGNGAIVLHSNSGLTFDIDSIRNLFPKFGSIFFTADIGITEAVDKDQLNITEFWVLIDGKVRHHMVQKDFKLKSEYVQIEILEEERFMTLVASDGDNLVDFDWWVVADPVITFK